MGSQTRRTGFYFYFFTGACPRPWADL